MDKIANMLSSIKNASMVKKKEIEIDYSKELESIAKILQTGGFLQEVKVFKPKGLSYKRLNIKLAFNGELPVLTEAKRVSKPGRRIYKAYDEIRRVKNGYGIAVISTSRGVVTDAEARKKKLGGEVICYIS